MTGAIAETTAVLQAYLRVMTASWPDLHPAMAGRRAGWEKATAAELDRELRGYLAESDASSRVRVLWKSGPDFRFAGCNEHFARDAGFPSARDIIGTDDFDRRLPWMAQAAKYRADDEEVYRAGAPKLDILERQKSAAGITWVRKMLADHAKRKPS